MAKKNYNYNPAFLKLKGSFMALKRKQTIHEDFK